ncbi:hypothetical protein [Thiocystis violacea]|uniref:hypothetical protein n=1 Tax=Thiocystis violacea TaxID=13725 RepID=UPI0019060F21|nr:hypothetical protein [Thiocystis violacea]MBK1717323.1 hypothetical protein [Thiocystis violacea]
MTTGLELTSFDDFLKLARRQAEPQQLLFVFTRSELPADHTPEQAARFAAGQGGHLAPVVCVGRGLHEIPGFQAFASEAEAHIDDWAVIFAAALPGIGHRPPTPLAIEQALDRMVETVRSGQIASYLAFDREGITLRLAMSH